MLDSPDEGAPRGARHDDYEIYATRSALSFEPVDGGDIGAWERRLLPESTSNRFRVAFGERTVTVSSAPRIDIDDVFARLCRSGVGRK